jgi:hypothetical protein
MIVRITGETAVSAARLKKALRQGDTCGNAGTIHFLDSNSLESFYIIVSGIFAYKSISANGFDWF